MMSWWWTDDELVRNWWGADDELKMNWWWTDVELMINWWWTDYELMMNWWWADDELMMSWWWTGDELMMSWWCTSDELMMNWWWTERFRTIKPKCWMGLDGYPWTDWLLDHLTVIIMLLVACSLHMKHGLMMSICVFSRACAPSGQKME